MLPADLHVRRPLATDAVALAELINALNRELGEPVQRMTPEHARADMLGEHPWMEAMLAEHGQQAIGYASFVRAYETSHAERGFYVQDLYVASAYRRQGVGRTLLSAVARLARERDASFLWWVSKPWNIDAQEVYRRVRAVDEPVHAHAVFGDAFNRLALTERERVER